MAHCQIKCIFIWTQNIVSLDGNVTIIEVILGELWKAHEELFFYESAYPQVGGFQKYGGHVSEKKKKRLRQRTHKFRASKNPGAIFLEKKAPAATYPQVKGFQNLAPLGFKPKNKVFERPGS